MTKAASLSYWTAHTCLCNLSHTNIVESGVRMNSRSGSKMLSRFDARTYHIRLPNVGYGLSAASSILFLDKESDFVCQ